jgi:MGT family glycosyltransferase
MRFWFTSAPLSGHLDWGGLLKTAQVLQSRGHDVIWISEAGIGGSIQRAGLPFEAVEQIGWLWPPPPLPDPRSLPPLDAMMLRYRRALDTWLSVDLAIPAVEALCALADRIGTPDAIVTDPFISAAAVAAEKLAIPLVVGGWPAGPPLDEDQLLYVQRELGRDGVHRIEQLREQFGIQGINFGGGSAPCVQSPLLHISYFNSYWYQGESFLPQTEFVGGMATSPRGDPPAWLADIPRDQPLGMVTLGSVFTGDLGFFAWGAHAIAAHGMIPLVVIGNNPITPEEKAELKRNLPGGTRLLNWVDFDHVFPRLKVLIHHGGMGTTHAAILHAIPQVIAPHAADQRGQARRARQAKIGLELSADDIRKGQLGPAVQAVMTTPLVIETARKLAESFAVLGGPDRAAELIIGCVKTV